MDHQFQNNSKFALLTVNIYTDLPPATFQLSDGTWVMPGVPVPDLGIWKDWIGSIRMESLRRANLVLVVEEPSKNPEIFDDCHRRLKNDLSRLFCMLHLQAGIDCSGGSGSADLLCGSSENGVPRIRQMSQLVTFHQSNGWQRAPITKAWLEEGLILRAGVVAMEAEKTQFRRVMSGLNTLSKGLKETGPDRLHQFVRSLEALILPDIGCTKRQFVHRCQTFARASDDTRALLQEAFDMRSDTEHLNPWDEAVRTEDVCWQRTRQIEHLACDAYSRVLRNVALMDQFRTEATIAAFWRLPDDQKLALWGKPLDIAQEPLVQKYHQSGRAIV